MGNVLRQRKILDAEHPDERAMQASGLVPEEMLVTSPEGRTAGAATGFASGNVSLRASGVSCVMRPPGGDPKVAVGRHLPDLYL